MLGDELAHRGRLRLPEGRTRFEVREEQGDRFGAVGGGRQLQRRVLTENLILEFLEAGAGSIPSSSARSSRSRRYTRRASAWRPDR